MIKFVKINNDRGWAPGLYEVLSRRGQSHGASLKLRLAGTRNPGVDLYEAHTYTDGDCIRASQRHASQIGLKP